MSDPPATDAVSSGPARPTGAALGDELACGRGVDGTLEQAADGRAEQLDEHQVSCPHCRAALGEFATLWAPFTAYAAEAISLPADFASQVMDRVHDLVRNTWYTANITEAGVVRVAARIVGRIARDAAQSVPGVRAALGRTTKGRLVRLVERATSGHLHPHAAVGVLGQTTSIDMAIAVEYRDPVREVAEAVQVRIRQRLHAAITLQDITVNVTVDDVWLDERRS